MGTGESRRAAGARNGAIRIRLVAALAAALGTAGCSAYGTPGVQAGSVATHTVAFESIDGPPVGVFNKLVQTLSSEAQARQIAIVSREGPAQFRIRGYLAAQIERGRTHIAWVWDVYDADRHRALRITGEEPGGRARRDAKTDPWGIADDQMLQRIARASIDRLAVFLSAPDGGEPAASPIVATVASPPGTIALAATTPR